VRYAYRVTPGLAELLELPVQQGLLLVEIQPGSPLTQGNVRGAQKEAILGNQRIFIGGDVLTAVNGQEITSLDALQLLLETEHRVGDQVDVTVVRAGESITVPLTLAEEPMAQ
jgi:S1-C subfamily serine protease